jgi:hypothetical protein
MNVEQLSVQGYKLTEVFDAELYSEIETFIETFVPDDIRAPADGPNWSLPLVNARRESIRIPEELKTRIVDSMNISDMFMPLVLGGAEAWRDYRGYRQDLHFDYQLVRHIMIVYFGGEGEEDIGTTYFEDDVEYTVPYYPNTGIILKDTNKIKHGLKSTVSIDYRKLIYLNWVERE